MGLSGALVDRARVISVATSNVRTEGTSLAVEHMGGWFKCRLTLPRSEERQAGISSIRAGAQDASTQRKRVVQRPTILFGLRDLDRNVLALTAEDRVEVVSKELGTFTFFVDGDPTPLRAKRKLLGWEATLRRVEDHAAADKATVVKPVGSPERV